VSILERARAIARAATGGAPPDAGGLPFEALYPTLPPTGIRRRSYPPARFVGSTTAAVLLAAANPSRVGLTIRNDSTANLYAAEGSGVSTSSYTDKLPPGGSIILEPPDVWTGDVYGVWDAVNGAARITETTPS